MIVGHTSVLISVLACSGFTGRLRAIRFNGSRPLTHPALDQSVFAGAGAQPRSDPASTIRVLLARRSSTSISSSVSLERSSLWVSVCWFVVDSGSSRDCSTGSSGTGFKRGIRRFTHTASAARSPFFVRSINVRKRIFPAGTVDLSRSLRKLAAEVKCLKVDEYGARGSASIVLCRIFIDMHKMKTSAVPDRTREMHRDRR
jgi:hypothetical protein